MVRRITFLAAACALLIAARPANAQSLFEQLERAIGGGNAPPAAEQPAERGYLGLLAEENDRGQIIVVEVDENGPAQRAGLQRGDRILQIAGRDVTDLDRMAAILEPLRVGNEIEVKYARQEAVRTTKIELGPQASALELVEGRLDEIPPPPPEPRGKAFLGVRTEPVSAALRQRYGLAVDHGAVILDVTRGSPADRAGLAAGSVIVEIADRRIDDPKQLANIVQDLPAGREVEVSYYRGRQLCRTTVTLGEAQADEPLRLRGGNADTPPPEPLPGEGVFDDLPRFGGDRPAGRLLNRVLEGVRQPDAPPPPQANAPPAASRIERLEATVDRLETRIAELEAKLQTLEE